MRKSHHLMPNALRFASVRLAVIVPLALLCAGGSAFLLLRAVSADAQPVRPKSPPTSELDPPPAPPVAKKYAPQELFVNWPKQKPDLVLLFSGQMYGYLQKCGCSDPQKGGLERRYNLIQSLRARGWEVVPIDLGDIAYMTKVPSQALLKYRVAMESMHDMGYRAVGIGKEEFRFPLLTALSEYSLNNPEPKIHAANVTNKNDFPSGDGKGSMLHEGDVIPTKSGIGVGVFSIIGKSLIDDLAKLDPTVKFGAPHLEKIMKNIDAAAKNARVESVLRVMIYPGSEKAEKDPPKDQAPIMQALRDAIEGARTIKELKLPRLHVILCPTAEAEPPNRPIVVGDTVIVQVGHRGQNVGILGVFKDGKGEPRLHYERVALGPEYETPEDKVKDDPILKRLEWYAREVKAQNFLAAWPKVPLPLQGKADQLIKQGALPKGAKAEYVGSDACKACHAAEYKVWAESKHAKAYAALSQIAKRPSQRNFDPECIRCHTVGFEYQTGFSDAEKTPQLMNVGCENCHGPGSLHAVQPHNKQWLAEQSPWKAGNAADRMPNNDKLKQLEHVKDAQGRMQILNRGEERVLRRVFDTCFKCHDTDNDPHFQVETFWPKIQHAPEVKKK